MTLPEPKQLDFFDLRLDESDQKAKPPGRPEPGGVAPTPTPVPFVAPEPSCEAVGAET